MEQLPASRSTRSSAFTRAPVALRRIRLGIMARNRALCALLAVTLAAAAVVGTVAAAPASTTMLLDTWAMQSSANVTADGSTISTRTYQPSGWYNVTAPATVLAGLVQNGVYEDPFYSLNLQAISTAPFEVTWWYRTQFAVPALTGDATPSTARVTFKGLNYRANVWLDGTLVGNASDTVGTFRYFDFNLGAVAPASQHVLAVECFRPVDAAFPPGNNDTDLAISFVDWAPPPPDMNMGLWREVELTVMRGPVAVRYPQVTTTLSGMAPGQEVHPSGVASGATATLTVLAELQNAGAKSVQAKVTVAMPGVFKGVLSQPVTVGAGATVQVELAAGHFPELNVADPALWWPWQMGPQTMHGLTIEVLVDGAVSDSLSTSFGMREATSELTSLGYRLYRVNGKALMVRAGGWAPDLFQRITRQRQVDEFTYVRDMGLNAIRLEGKMQNDDFFATGDEFGVMTIPGWCCCDAWQHWKAWGPEQHAVATASLRDQVKRLRIHPSVLAFWYSSDELPPTDVEEAYLGVFKTEKWPNPVLASASNLTSTITGPTGVKMSGPYAWVPPSYWLTDTPGFTQEQLGGAYGFLSEGGPGASPMPLASLEATIPSDKLWPLNFEWDWHCGNQVGLFGNLRFFTPPMYARYGDATSAAEYAMKAQVSTYESHRAMFEAYGRNKYTSTGLVQWMLNSAFPSNMWNLYDPYLRPGGAYFGTKIANEPMHPMYSYNDGSLWVVNSQYTPVAEGVFTLHAEWYDLNGTVLTRATHAVPAVAADAPLRVAGSQPVPEPSTPTYFVRLQLVSLAYSTPWNTYTLSTKPDVMDWAKSNFYITPCSSYADMTALGSLPAATATSSVTWHNTGSQYTASVSLSNPAQHLGGVVSFFGYASVTQGAGGDAVLPIVWDANYVTLMPGDNVVLVGSFNYTHTVPPHVEVTWWNDVVHP